MSRALMGIADRIANEGENGSQTTLGANSQSAQNKAGQNSAAQGPFDKIKSALADLKKLQEDTSHVNKIEPDNLKTLCKLSLVDVCVSDKGKETIQSFEAVESLAGELQGAAPAIDTITKYRKEHKMLPG